MREILFKAKRKDNGEWVEGYIVFCNGKINPGQAYIAPVVSSVIALEDWAGLRLGPFVEVDPETVCQCTNKPDKNGKQIFEDDLIRFKEWSQGKPCWIGKVIYENGLFVIHGGPNEECGESDFYIQLSRLPTDRMEVIGNIHDEED